MTLTWICPGIFEMLFKTDDHANDGKIQINLNLMSLNIYAFRCKLIKHMDIKKGSKF